MICIYDGTFLGLLTVIYDYYKDLKNIEISADSNQISMFKKVYVDTNFVKAKRVEEVICEKFSQKTFKDLFKVYKSNHDKKEETVANIIKGLFKYGEDYVNSTEEYSILFREILKNFSSENHTYKGILRFREIQDDFLFAQMEPNNDILEYLTVHFIKRMPNEKFIIYDKNREKASINIYGETEIVKVVEMNPEDTDEEKIFKSAWRMFYDSIGIDERKNTKLMISNMPKKYWKYLPEKNKNI